MTARPSAPPASRRDRATGPVCPPIRRDSSTHSPNGTTGPTVLNVPAPCRGAASRAARTTWSRTSTTWVGHVRGVRHQHRLRAGPGRPGPPRRRSGPVWSPGPPISPDRATSSRSPTAARQSPLAGGLRRAVLLAVDLVGVGRCHECGATRRRPGCPEWRRRCRRRRTSSAGPGRRGRPGRPGRNRAARTPRRPRPSPGRAAASYAPGSRRSAGISRAPSATDPLSPRARQVTEAPRANACSANSRPSHCVPPSTSTSIGPIDHSGPVRGNALRGGRNRGPTGRARRPGGRRALRYRFCDQAVNFTLRRRAITNRATPTASSRAAPPTMPPMAAPVTGRLPPPPLSSQSAGAW